MKDWQAALAGYLILTVIGETEAAGLAVVLAWGVAISMLLAEASSGDLSKVTTEATSTNGNA